jgi:hypothetical protein
MNFLYFRRLFVRFGATASLSLHNRRLFIFAPGKPSRGRALTLLSEWDKVLFIRRLPSGYWSSSAKQDDLRFNKEVRSEASEVG